MMSRTQYCLNRLAGESSEVAHIALKTQEFGLHEVCPGQPFTNAERIHQELDDQAAVLELLNGEADFKYTPNRERIEAKKAKIAKFYAYSVSLGQVDPIPTRPDTKIFHKNTTREIA